MEDRSKSSTGDLPFIAEGHSVAHAGKRAQIPYVEVEAQSLEVVSSPFVESTLREVSTRLDTTRPAVHSDKAPNLTLAVIIALEFYVVSHKPAFERAFAWLRLVKLWACLRYDDTLAIDPWKTNTTGPGRHVDRDATLTRGLTGLKQDLWQSFASARDYFIPRPSELFDQQMASTEEVTACPCGTLMATAGSLVTSPSYH
eukprot:4528924-Amphidinium_carterae.2